MHTTSRRPRSRLDRQVPAKQIDRWLDDGGSPSEARAASAEKRVPVTWSPTALNSRLEAERAVRGLGLRAPAEARRRIASIVTLVDQRRLAQKAAAAQLRGVTRWLEQLGRSNMLRNRANERTGVSSGR